MDVDSLVTWGPVPLTLVLSMMVTNWVKALLGSHSEHPWSKRLLPLVAPAFGALLGLIPSFLPADRVPPVLLGLAIGGWGPFFYGLRNRKAAVRRSVRPGRLP